MNYRILGKTGFRVLKERCENKYQAVYEKTINFGHVVWSGNILGKRGIIVGNRAGDKSIEFLYPTAPDFKKMNTVLIDTDAAPTNILVINKGYEANIFSANHGAGEVVMYTLED